MKCFSSSIKNLQSDVLQADPSDEDIFLFNTLESVGSLVKDDVKMGTLYCTLILATPGAALSQASRVGTLTGQSPFVTCLKVAIASTFLMIGKLGCIIVSY